MAPCLPFPPACAKGRRTLSRAGQAGLWKPSAGRGPAQEVSPAGSVGAERCPPGTSAPRRGFPAKSLPLEAFSTLLRLPKATKAVGRCPTPCKPFEKGLSENFYSPTARTCAGCQHRRGRSRRPKARIESAGTARSPVFLRIDDLGELLHKAVDILKLAVHRGKPHIGHLVHVLQLLHCVSSYALGGNLPVQRVL